MLTAAVEPDLGASRQQKCVRAVAKPVKITWQDRKGRNLGPAEGKNAVSLAVSLFSGVVNDPIMPSN
jgi:hypothetical protein